MNARVAFKSVAGPVSMSKRQAGFTLVGTAISLMLGGIVLTGAWMAVRDMQAQLHVSWANRQMDQYAASAMQDLTNKLSWAWSAEQVIGGTRNTRWNFMLRDEVSQYGTWTPNYPLQPYRLTQLRYHPNRGILIGDQVPKWVKEGNTEWYRWFGLPSRPGSRRDFDRRDRMTMESLQIEWPASRWAESAEWEKEKYALATIELRMAYRYQNRSLLGLYPREYVRERTYKTSVYCRNWHSVLNQDSRDRLVPVSGS